MKPDATAFAPELRDWGVGLLFDAIKDAVIVADANTGRIVLWNRGAVTLFKYTAAEALDLCLEDLVPPALRERHKAGLASFARRGRRRLVDADTHAELPAVRKDGVQIIVQLTLSHVSHRDNPDGRYAMGLLRDITKEREAEQIARLMLDAAAHPVFALDLSGMCTLINAAATAALGYRAEELVGRDMHLVLHHSYADGSPYPASACPIHDALSHGTSMTVEDEVFWRADGSAFPVEYKSEPILLAGTVLGAVVTFTDISDRKRVEAEALAQALELPHRAETDVLTGIGNRRFATEVLDSLQAADAVVLIDVDRFKSINDNYGHSAGDEVLVSLAAHLRSHLRTGDSVARLGGEEFLVVLRNGGAGALASIQRMAETWEAPVVGTTFTAGIAKHHAGATGTETLQCADGAMYQGKRAGRGRVVAYQPPPAPSTAG